MCPPRDTAAQPSAVIGLILVPPSAARRRALLQYEFDAAVAGAGLFVGAVVSRAIGSVGADSQALRVHAALDQVAAHGVGALFAELHVEGARTGGVGVAFDAHVLDLG